ncbi:MAG: molybdopterin molybdotransferase MoeA [Proteobacteria bacterium]|nr:molybdopterin molybdotransferase MoeA [Pseudomonadota bacterium]
MRTTSLSSVPGFFYMRYDVSLETAHRILLNASSPVEMGVVTIGDAYGRILSRDVFSPINLPPFRKSAMDGYALRSFDIAKASRKKPVRLRVIDQARAGYMPENGIRPGTAVNVMTGAVVPDGADVVVRSEDVDLCSEGIIVNKAFCAGTYLVMPGEDVPMGESIARKGALITPPMVGLLAGLGLVQIPVYRKVVIALMSTGDELIDPADPYRPGKIFNSSLYGILGRCQAAGAQPLHLGTVPDQVTRVAEKMSEGLEKADIVITTGGTSNGLFDVTKDAMLLAGAEILFNGVAVKSGSPIFAGKRNGRFIISLPGNPAGAMAAFDLIVMVLINNLRGLSHPFLPRIEAVMAGSYLRFSPVRRLLHARLFRQYGVDYVALADHHSRCMVESIVDSNFFIDVPAGSRYIQAGERVWGFPVGDLGRVYSDIAVQMVEKNAGLFHADYTSAQ